MHFGYWRKISNSYKTIQKTCIVVGNVDNNLQKINLKFRGLKEGAEGGNLKVFVENLFMRFLSSDSNVKVKLRFAYRVRSFGRAKGTHRVRDVLMGILDWPMKSMVLDALWDSPKIMAGIYFLFRSLPAHPKKRREWKFIPNH